MNAKADRGRGLTKKQQRQAEHEANVIVSNLATEKRKKELARWQKGGKR